MPSPRRLHDDEGSRRPPEVLAVTQELRDSLRRFQRALDGFDSAVAEHLGVNRTDLRCIDLIEDRGPMSAGDLATGCNLSSGAMTFVIDRLERAKIVRRVRDTLDRRRVFVELEPEADERAWALHEPMVRSARSMLRQFSIDELKIVAGFLTALYQVYERHSAELHEQLLERH